MQLCKSAALLAFGLGQLVAASSVRTECRTKSACTPGPTQTHFLGTQTAVQTKKVVKVVTSTSTVTPRATTSTSYTADISTVTVNEPVATDTFTTTETSFAITSTVVQETAPTVTPTSTVFTVSIGPEVTTTVVSYTIPPPAPTILSPQDRRDLDLFEPAVAAEEGLFRRQSGSFVTVNGITVPKSSVYSLSSGNLTSLQKRGGKKKDVYCSALVTKISTITATKTAVLTTKASCQTITIISPVPGTVTTTIMPKDASTTVTVSTSLVITVSPVTQTTTPTAAVFTTTSTIVAQATATIVASYYTVCDPSRQYGLDHWTETDGGSMYIGTTPDALTCCQEVAAVPGAVAFAFCVDGSTADDCQGGRVNACYGIEIGNTALCVAGNPATQYFYQAGNGEVGASLQCGTGSIG